MSEMLLVGCKLPHGFIMELPPEATKETFMKPTPPGKRFTIAGAASLRNRDSKKALARYDFAFTPVPKEFADEWFRVNKDRSCVTGGFVFVADKQDRANGIAQDRVAVVTGLEPLNGTVDDRGRPVDKRLQSKVQNDAFAEPMGI